MPLEITKGPLFVHLVPVSILVREKFRSGDRLFVQRVPSATLKSPALVFFPYTRKECFFDIP